MQTTMFEPGQVSATPGAMAYLEEHDLDPFHLLARHLSGDWGDMDEEDKRANDHALLTGARIISGYGEGDSRNVRGVWIITEADRSRTTMLRPTEY